MGRKRLEAGQKGTVAGILTVTEIADYLKISRSMIYRLLKRGEIPGFKIGSDCRFNLDEIDQWLAKQEIKPR
jgi:putative molybdopterin biosynthesis protein